ncbi:hypothetical protein FOA52_008866 [Chlamydomonas sp. UWO 241]|nr:hypothetical protein FOA52_008866 [Chlamydomonas sp. UWO 241]
MAADTGGDGGAPWSTSYTWRVEDFSKQTEDETIWSNSFEAGVCTWKLRVYPGGWSAAKGTHLSVFLEAQDAMWAPSAEFKLTLVNQADASKSSSHDATSTFKADAFADGRPKFIELSALRGAGAGWLVNDALLLTVEVTVKREDRFQLDTGGVPCDVTLKLPCGAEVPAYSQLLRLASPFFRGALEDVKGSGPIPVDGSLGTWAYILSCLCPLHDQPELTLLSVYTLLPVVHKYDFPRLLTRLVAFIKGKSTALSHDPASSAAYIVRWLALAERLQLDELRELCLGKLRGMTREQLQSAITVQAGSGADRLKKQAVRKDVRELSHELLVELLSITAPAPAPAPAPVPVCFKCAATAPVFGSSAFGNFAVAPAQGAAFGGGFGG